MGRPFHGLTGGFPPPRLNALQMHVQFGSVLVFVPTASHCSDDRAIDAGGSVTNALSSPELLR